LQIGDVLRNAAAIMKSSHIVMLQVEAKSINGMCFREKEPSVGEKSDNSELRSGAGKGKGA
jgi:hypothetical protein